MPTVLVTGSAGRIGRVVVGRLAAEGWTVRPFDVAGGDDLLDRDAVAEAVRGCTAIVHAGALAHDTAGDPADIVATNVLGTWHVLLVAAHAAHAGHLRLTLCGPGDFDTTPARHTLAWTPTRTWL